MKTENWIFELTARSSSENHIQVVYMEYIFRTLAHVYYDYMCVMQKKMLIFFLDDWQ
jgi:hypothetical protein